MKNRKTKLRAESLDDRLVPAALVDLTSYGSSGIANGAIFRQADPQPTGSGVIHSFVRIQGSGVEQGYNTDARPLQFDENKSPTFTRSLAVGDVPVVHVGNTDYREFMLDINQKSSSPLLSLDELRLYIGGARNLTGYNSTTNSLAGLTPAYDMDGAGDATVKMDYRLNPGSGGGDMFVLIPNSAFAGSSPNSFVYLYSKFGGSWGANSGFEEWAVRQGCGCAPQPAQQTSSLSGLVYIDNDGLPGYAAGADIPVAGVQMTLLDGNGNIVQMTTSGADGTYTFTNLGAGTYTIQKGTLDPNVYDPSVYYDFGNSVGTVNGSLDGSYNGPTSISQITLGLGQNGISYNFIEAMTNNTPG